MGGYHAVCQLGLVAFLECGIGHAPFCLSWRCTLSSMCRPPSSARCVSCGPRARHNHIDDEASPPRIAISPFLKLPLLEQAAAQTAD